MHIAKVKKASLRNKQTKNTHQKPKNPHAVGLQLYDSGKGIIYGDSKKMSGYQGIP